MDSSTLIDKNATIAENAYKNRVRKISGKPVEVKTSDHEAKQMGQKVKEEFTKLLTQPGLFSPKAEDDASVKLAKKLQEEELRKVGFKPR